MPRFHFNFSDGVADPDVEGFELATIAAAHEAAAKFVGQWLIDNAVDFWSDGERLLTVTDENGLVLFTLRVSAQAAPVLQIIATTDPEGEI